MIDSPQNKLKSQKQPISQQRIQHRRLKSIIKTASVSILLFIILISPLVLIYNNYSSLRYSSNEYLEHVDTLEYRYDNISYPSRLIKLEVSEIGSLTVIYEPNPDHFFQAEIRVFGQQGYSKNPIKDPGQFFKITHTKYGTMEIAINSSYLYRELQYELIITISSDLTVNLIVHDIDGDIHIIADSALLVFYFYRIRGDIHISADSSNGGSLNIFACYGNLNLLFSNVTVNSLNIQTYNNVEAIFFNSNFLPGSHNFTIHSEELSLRIEQEKCNDSSSSSVNWDIESSIINCVYRFSSSIGVGFDVTGDVKSENITISGFPSQLELPYHCDNYNDFPLRHFFDIECVSKSNNGSVSIIAI